MFDQRGLHKICFVDALHSEISAGYYCGRLGPGLPHPDLNVGAWDCGSAGNLSRGNRIGSSGLVWAPSQKESEGPKPTLLTLLSWVLCSMGPTGFFKGPQETSAAPHGESLPPVSAGYAESKGKATKMNLSHYSYPPSNQIGPGRSRPNPPTTQAPRQYKNTGDRLTALQKFKIQAGV